MTDCVLISPPFIFEKGNMWKEVRAKDPPLGLAALAAWVRKENFSVSIIDGNLYKEPYNDIIVKIKDITKRQNKPIKIIGITCCTTTAYVAYKIANSLKVLFPQSLIVMGGPHPTFAYNEVLLQKGVDIVVIGEGEQTLTELLNNNRLTDIDGIAYKNNNKIFLNPPRKRIKNIDDLPIPAYDLLEIKNYRPPLGSFKKLPSFIITVSRGCPGNCSFCTKTLGDYHTQKSAHKIIEEILFLKNNYGIKDIVFHDDTFTANKNNVVQFCNLMINKRINISWHCFSRVDYVDEGLLKLMKKAGCHQIMFGVETFDQKILNNYRKNFNLQEVNTLIKLMKNINITSRLSFILGGPHDTKKSIENTIYQAKKINPDLIVVNMATPFPGTTLFNQALATNTLLSTNWENFTGAVPLISSQELSSSDLINYYRRFYLSFYLRPFKIISFIIRTKYYGGLFYIIKAGIGIIRMSRNIF